MSVLYLPSRCTSDLPDEFGEHHVAEVKMDGSRYVLYIGDNIDPYGRQESHTLLSRRVSTVDNKHVDRTLQIPHITDQLYQMSVMGTVLDGEIFKDDFQTTTSIIGSGPKLAIEKQEREGYLKYHVWDVMQFRGQDVRGLTLSKRRKILLEVCDRLNNPYIIPIEQFETNFEEKFHDITGEGGEGLIVKDSRMGYGIGWAKWKKAYEVTAVITGFTPASPGKYSGLVGAMKLSVYDHSGRECLIGKTSGFSDAIRMDMTKNPENYVGRCVDVNTMRLNKPSSDHPHGRLFQPSFHRFRDDYNASEVTLEKLKADLKKKAKSNRNKFGG